MLADSSTSGSDATTRDRSSTPGEGLRVGEVIRLDRDDVDFDQGALAIRNSKAGRSRVVPLRLS